MEVSKCLIEIEVIFRYDEKTKEIVAFFNDYNKYTNMVTCYTNKEQHNSATLGYYATTRKATKDEYYPLLKELESRGYDVIIKKKIKK